MGITVKLKPAVLISYVTYIFIIYLRNIHIYMYMNNRGWKERGCGSDNI